MKNFISNVVLLLLITILSVVILTVGMYLLQSRASFKLPVEKNILVVGDSHTECAIDDGVFSRAINVSQSASTCLYSYCKTKKFLDENRHVDMVIMSFHYPPLMSTVDDQWVFNEVRMFNMIPRYFLLMDKDDLASFMNRKVSLFRAILSLPYRNAFKFIMTGRLSHEDLKIGKYQKLDRDKLQEHIARMNEQTTVEDTTISLLQKEYLLKIVDLCRSRNVELILINTPTYKPEKYGNLDKLRAYYNTYLPGVKYMDYSAFPLPDSCYGDISHLNYKGAEVFSKYLQENFTRDLATGSSTFPVRGK